MDERLLDVHSNRTSSRPLNLFLLRLILLPPSIVQVPLGDVNGHVPSVVMTHTDVTDTKRLQEVSIAHERSRFEEAEKLRKKANEEKSILCPFCPLQTTRADLPTTASSTIRRQQEFMISVISHELRNPVSAIIQVSVKLPNHSSFAAHSRLTQPSACNQCVNLVSSNLVFLRNELQSCL